MSHSGKTLSSVSRRVALVRFRNKSSQLDGSDSGRRANVWKKILDDVCDQCSLHGLNHIVGKDRSTGEKAFWSVTVICAMLFATYAIVESWKSYNKSTIDTVVETTFLSYADIAFPMVVVCDSSRVDWERVVRLSARDVPGIDPDLLPVVRKLLKTFSVLSYGEFNEFDELKNVTELSKLVSLNLTELLVKVMRPCDEMFTDGGCWWNFKVVNCCDIFELQRTEFGLCYSFNSDFSEYSRARLGADSGLIGAFWRTESGDLRPRRTGDNGQWSGVRMYVSTMRPEQVAPGIDAKPSTRKLQDFSIYIGRSEDIIFSYVQNTQQRERYDLQIYTYLYNTWVIMIGEPRGAPLGSDMVVMAGSIGIIHLWGDRIYNTPRTRRLNPKERRCLFADESSTGMGTKYYLRRNCKTACYMNQMVNQCGCYLEFMFGLMHQNDSLRPCNVRDLLCLSEKNKFFKSIIPFDQNAFMKNDVPGLKCNCMPDCVHQMYISELTIAEPSISTVLNSSLSILIDAHFTQSTGILYRSDLVLGWLDLLVSFGGCAGLFLGGSLLSFIELIYFLTWKAYHHWCQTPSTKVFASKSTRKRKHPRRITTDTWTMDDTRAKNNDETDRFSYHI